MKWIDLRSDTVTLPTEKMRKAMAEAELGDDVYGEDPTINRLQELAAAKLGKEAALFVPSGTMGNLASILAHCQRGDEAIMGDRAHTFLYEAGGIAALGGAHPHTVPNQPDGTLKFEDIKAAIRIDDAHFPVTKLLVLENTHNQCGGVSLSKSYMDQAACIAHQAGLLVHLDGARLFNASIDQETPVEQMTAMVDSVTICLSKGLCAPVGSVICGDKEFIRKVHRMRKQLGGGMRQAGVLAAAGIVALEDMPERLIEDHERAAEIALRLAEIPGIRLDRGSPNTNMVYIEIEASSSLTADVFAHQLRDEGILVGVTGKHQIRLVCHYWVRDEDLTKIQSGFQSAMEV